VVDQFTQRFPGRSVVVLEKDARYCALVWSCYTSRSGLCAAFMQDPCGERLTDPSPDDGQKLVGMQAGAANEGTVHAGPGKQRGGVIRLDAAAVLDGKGLRADFSSKS
jgi:hypothetical protein